MGSWQGIPKRTKVGDARRFFHDPTYGTYAEVLVSSKKLAAEYKVFFSRSWPANAICRNYKRIEQSSSKVLGRETGFRYV